MEIVASEPGNSSPVPGPKNRTRFWDGTVTDNDGSATAPRTIRRFRHRTRQSDTACRHGFWNGPLLFTMDYLMLMSETQTTAVSRKPSGAGTEPKRKRPRGDACSILLVASRWLKQQLDLFNRVLERSHRVYGHLQMGHDHAVLNRLVTNRHVPVSLQREGHNLAAVAVVANPVGVNERSAMAANAR